MAIKEPMEADTEDEREQRAYITSTTKKPAIPFVDTGEYGSEEGKEAEKQTQAKNYARYQRVGSEKQKQHLLDIHAKAWKRPVTKPAPKR